MLGVNVLVVSLEHDLGCFFETLALFPSVNGAASIEQATLVVIDYRNIQGLEVVARCPLMVTVTEPCRDKWVVFLVVFLN